MRLLEQAGLSGLWLSLLLYGAASVSGLVLARREFGWLGRRPGLMFWIALTTGWTNLAFILAILDGNVMRVLLLFYLSPVWAVLLGWLFLKERISRSSLAVIVIALAGGLLMLWRPDRGIPWPRDAADWFALSAGFAFATSNILIRYGAEVPVSIKSLVVWIGVVVLAVLMILWRQPALPVLNLANTSGVIALGLLGMVTMTMLVQYGVSHMPVHRSAIILLFELVAGAVSQQLLTNELMTGPEWGGGLLVIAAAAMTAWRERG
jgi:drug/metabolite transporter (DMT)-like permease